MSLFKGVASKFVPDRPLHPDLVQRFLDEGEEATFDVHPVARVRFWRELGEKCQEKAVAQAKQNEDHGVPDA